MPSKPKALFHVFLPVESSFDKFMYEQARDFLLRFIYSEKPRIGEIARAMGVHPVRLGRMLRALELKQDLCESKKAYKQANRKPPSDSTETPTGETAS